MATTKLFIALVETHMTKDESKHRILKKWETWKANPNQATYQEMQEFYFWIETNHSDLLQWRIRPGMDRWQDVRGWLNVRTNYSGTTALRSKVAKEK